MAYFHEIRERFGTGLWVNNPTPEEADRAVRDGALGCTTNPTFAARMVAEGVVTAEQIADAVSTHGEQAPAAVQRLALAHLLPSFRPQWTGVDGHRGWVSIQADPFAEDDSAAIIAAARADRALGDNVIAKIPVTAAGLEAIEVLAAEGCPILATEVFAMAQVIALAETWQRATASLATKPCLIVTHISGIYDEYLAGVAGDQVPTAALRHAGCLLARRELGVLADHGWSIPQMGGGLRGLHHFTEMVGAPVLVTANPRDIDTLIAEPPALADRFHADEATAHLADLLTLPDFAAAWQLDGLAVAEFADFGPVRFFRDMFETGWRKLANACGCEVPA